MTQTNLAATTKKAPTFAVESDQQKSHQLPDEISSWASLLQAFLSDLRMPLEQMGNVLSKVIKVLPLQEMAGQDEPDGIEGIHSLVNYERLLTSEWAIYHDFPEEFIRRAAFKEHQFYKLAHRERTNDEAVYVLLDCGPEQLGRPRVVQLAVLILLLRYAEGMQAKLHWGVIQDAKQQWFEGISPTLIENWLQMCSADLLDKSVLTQRLDGLDQTLLANGRVWCVTPEPLDDFTQLMQVNIQGDRQAAADEQRKITVRVGRAHRQQLQTLLLPEDKLCNQILNNPFKQETVQVNQSKSWLLNQTGTILVLFNASRYLKSFKILARNPSTQLPIAKQTTILGVYVNKRGTYILSATSDEYLLQGFPPQFKHKRYKKSHDIQLNDQLPSMAVILKTELILLVDAKRNLRCLRFSEDICSVETVAKSVYAFGYNGNYFYYIDLDPKQRTLSLHWGAEGQPNFKWIKHATLQTQVQRSKPEVFIDQTSWNLKDGGRVAFRVSETEWNIRYPGVEDFISVIVSPDLQVIGLHRLTDPKAVVHQSALVCMNKQDRQTFTLIGDDYNEVIYVLPEPCVRAELNPQRPYLHYQTEKGLLKTIEISTRKEMTSWDLNA